MWYDILKENDPEWVMSREKEKLGPSAMSGAFTMDMFKNQNWIKQLDRLLSLTKFNPETGKQQEVAAKIKTETLNNAVQYAIDLLDSMLKHSNLGEKLLESSEKYAESTRTFAREHQRPEPPIGESGRGMIPKRVEHIANATSRAFDKNIEQLISYVHNIVDELHSREEKPKLESEKFQMGDTIPEEIKSYVWEEAGIKDITEEFTQSICAGLFGEIDKTKNPMGDVGKKQQIAQITQDMINNENTKSFMVNLFMILHTKIKKGMGARSEESWEVELADKLTPEELKTFKKLTNLMELDIGPFKVAQEVKPEIDLETGILHEEQFDPETGEQYYIPQAIGEISDPDFDPADEVFEEQDKGKAFRRPSTSNAPQVKDYVPGSRRREGEPHMQVPPEIEEWQEKNAMQKLQTDSFERSWETLKKR